MDLCKFMEAQSKYMKLTWLDNCRERAGCVRFAVAKKRLYKGEDLNALVSNTVAQVLNKYRHIKATAIQDSGSEYEQENFNLKLLNIRRDCNTE